MARMIGVAVAMSVVGMSAAEAGIIYRWQNVTPDATFGALTAQIEFFDRFRNRSVSADGDAERDFLPITLVPVQAFSASFANGDGPFLDWSFAPCSTLGGFCPPGTDPAELVLRDYIFAIATQLGRELTGGSLFFIDQQQDFDMRYSAADGLWHFTHIGSDLSNRACNAGDADCTGTGRWVLKVAEPPPLALLPLLGLLALPRLLADLGHRLRQPRRAGQRRLAGSEGAEAMQERDPRATIVAIPDAGHAPALVRQGELEAIAGRMGL